MMKVMMMMMRMMRMVMVMKMRFGLFESSCATFPRIRLKP